MLLVPIRRVLLKTTGMRNHLRSGKPCCNSLQDFDISDICIIKARGVDNDNAIVLEAWIHITWVHDDWFEVCSA